jgi:hypothetical protein
MRDDRNSIAARMMRHSKLRLKFVQLHKTPATPSISLKPPARQQNGQRTAAIQ